MNKKIYDVQADGLGFLAQVDNWNTLRDIENVYQPAATYEPNGRKLDGTEKQTIIELMAGLGFVLDNSDWRSEGGWNTAENVQLTYKMLSALRELNAPDPDRKVSRNT